MPSETSSSEPSGLFKKASVVKMITDNPVVQFLPNQVKKILPQRKPEPELGAATPGGRRTRSLLVARPPPKSRGDGKNLVATKEEADTATLLQAPALPPFRVGSAKMLTGNKIYALLIFVPIAFACEYLEAPEATKFAMACLAILPLAGLLGDATEQVALHTNDTLGGLLNATFGNATELIVAYFALKRDLLTVVQVSLLGSILSNTLLVLGASCLAGGLRATVVKFNQTAAQANTTLLHIAILGLVVPTLMNGIGQLPMGGEVDLELSRATAVALLVLYLLYVYFQLFTHRKLFEDPRGADGGGEDEEDEQDEQDEEEEVLLSLGGGVLWLVLATAFIAVLSELLTGSIEGAAEGMGLSDGFVGFVILPIIGNAAEHSTAVVMANKGKMDLAFGVALGSSTQIALFVIPFMVLVGWAMDKPLDLLFGQFETAIVFLSSLIVSQIVGDGETNWLEGVMLLFVYMLISFAFFFYTPPGEL